VLQAYQIYHAIKFRHLFLLLAFFSSLFEYLLLPFELFLDKYCFVCLKPRSVSAEHVSPVFSDLLLFRSFFFDFFFLDNWILLETMDEIVIVQVNRKEIDEAGVSDNVNPTSAEHQRLVYCLNLAVLGAQRATEGGEGIAEVKYALL
jgi:hypothetical protein